MSAVGSTDGGQNGIVEELHVFEDGGVVVLARDGVRFLDSARRLERTVEFVKTYLWTMLFRAADGIWVAGLHGAPEGRELHAFPLGERAARFVWECKRCFRLAAVDFDGNGHDSIVVLNPQEYGDDSPWWVQEPPPFRTAFWIVDPPSSGKRLVVSDNHATRIRTLDLEGDGREEVVLYPYPAINASRYPFQHMSVLRGDGHEPLWDTEGNERTKWRLPPLDRVGYVPVRPGPEARFAKISMFSQHLQLADAQGSLVSSHQLPGDVTAVTHRWISRMPAPLTGVTSFGHSTPRTSTDPRIAMTARRNPLFLDRYPRTVAPSGVPPYERPKFSSYLRSSARPTTR
ncbi:MAG: hypothetical protein OXH09_18870 [Gammaproteobacteria bacterium]|nr:hypothetical protein [Gammaproteobacteria bacterium]